MKKLIENRTLEDTRNREVVGRLAIPERKSSGVFFNRFQTNKRKKWIILKT